MRQRRRKPLFSVPPIFGAERVSIVFKMVQNEQITI